MIKTFKNVLETKIKEWKKWKIRNERNAAWARWGTKMTENKNVIIKDKKLNRNIKKKKT